MYKIIQLLIYTFTNRLTKSVHVTLNEGFPGQDRAKEIRLRMEDVHKCNVTLVFTDSGTPSTFEWIYIKK